MKKFYYIGLMTRRKFHPRTPGTRLTHCKLCGELNPLKNYKFCSLTCSKLHARNKSLVAHTKQSKERLTFCQVCGEENPPTSVKFCSVACLDASRASISTEPVVYDKTCQFCDKPFKTEQKITKTCSDECRLKLIKKTSMKLRKSTCKYCETEIVKVSIQPLIFCSDECREKQKKVNYHNMRKRNKHKYDKFYQRPDKKYNLECDGCAKFFWSHNPLFRFCRPSCAKTYTCDYYDLRKSITDDSLPIRLNGKILHPLGSVERPRKPSPTDDDKSEIRGNSLTTEQSGTNDDPYTRGCEICGDIIPSHNPKQTWCGELCRIHVQEPHRFID